MSLILAFPILLCVKNLLDQSKGAITRLTIAITLIKIFMEGPDVSLKGSPTVSPTTAAA